MNSNSLSLPFKLVGFDISAGKTAPKRPIGNLQGVQGGVKKQASRTSGGDKRSKELWLFLSRFEHSQSPRS